MYVCIQAVSERMLLDVAGEKPISSYCMYSWTRRVDVRMYVCTYDRWKFASFFTAGHYVIRVYVCMYIPSAVQLLKICRV